MVKFKKIAVLTSGGDAPGMNACVRAVSRYAADKGIEVVGVAGGYRGLIYDEFIDLPAAFTANIIRRAGTALYTDRCNEFKTEEGLQKAVEICKKHGIEAIVAIGGDGTFRGANDLCLRGIPTIGIPGTIDNDITATDYTIGFDTAQNTVIEALGYLHDTCESHSRCNVVEIMGRECGELTLKAGIAAGALGVVIPEIPFDEAVAIRNIKKLKAAGQRGMLVAVSEGVRTPDGQKYSEVLAKNIEKETGIVTKFCRLAHYQRGGRPSAKDRFTASIMGKKAIDLLMEGKSNMFVCKTKGKIEAVDINWALAADHMYKNRLKDGELDKFTADQINEMKSLCDRRTKEIKELYDFQNVLSKA